MHIYKVSDKKDTGYERVKVKHKHKVKKKRKKYYFLCNIFFRGILVYHI